MLASDRPPSLVHEVGLPSDLLEAHQGAYLFNSEQLAAGPGCGLGNFGRCGAEAVGLEHSTVQLRG